MPKALTDMQRVILASAASRDNRRVYPVPTSINKNAGAIALSLRGTLASRLIDEVLAERGDHAWRTAESGEPITLIISDAGLAAIGVSTTAGPALDRVPALEKLPPTDRAGSKLTLIIDRLRQPCGATIEELVAATGWQKHSVRGAISGALKTKRKLNVISELVAGTGRVYRIPTGAEPTPDVIGSDCAARGDQA